MLLSNQSGYSLGYLHRRFGGSETRRGRRRRGKRRKSKRALCFYPTATLSPYHLIISAGLASHPFASFASISRRAFSEPFQALFFKMTSLATIYPATVPRHYRAVVHSFNGCIIGSAMQLISTARSTQALIMQSLRQMNQPRAVSRGSRLMALSTKFPEEEMKIK